MVARWHNYIALIKYHHYFIRSCNQINGIHIGLRLPFLYTIQSNRMFLNSWKSWVGVMMVKNSNGGHTEKHTNELVAIFCTYRSCIWLYCLNATKNFVWIWNRKLNTGQWFLLFASSYSKLYKLQTVKKKKKKTKNVWLHFQIFLWLTIL